MGFTFKILLNKRRLNAEELYPIVLRIYQAGIYKEFSLRIKIHPIDWDEATQSVKESNLDFKIYNAKILNEKSRLQKILLLADIDPTKFQSIDDIIVSLTPEKQQAKKEHPSFIKYAAIQVKQLEQTGKAGNSIVYSCALNKLKEYIGKGQDITFQQFDFKFLTNFTNSMLKEGIKINSISVYMRTLRAIFNKAVKEGVVSDSLYPYKAYRIKSEKTISRTLTWDEIRAIVQCELPVNSPAWTWRNYFLLSFCLIGINFADLLTLTNANISDGRIVFRRRKTGKIYSIKIHPETTHLISLCRCKSSDRNDLLFPIVKYPGDPMRLKKEIWQAIKTCNGYLNKIAGKCGISKDITTYYARYTWANIAKSIGYSKDIIAEALGHEYGNAVTGIYLDSYNADIIDNANKLVIDHIFNPNAAAHS